MMWRLLRSQVISKVLESLVLLLTTFLPRSHSAKYSLREENLLGTIFVHNIILNTSREARFAHHPAAPKLFAHYPCWSDQFMTCSLLVQYGAVQCKGYRLCKRHAPIDDITAHVHLLHPH